MIGSSDGKQYESEFYLAIGVPITPKDKDVKEGDSAPAGKPEPKGGYDPSLIDRDHHVPLVASAITDKDNQMTGMAIDHRIPAKPGYEKHLWNHESFENDYMNDLVKNGESSVDAYHKAHDWSTARESAAVTAEFGEKGLEAYKQHWRDAASVAAEPTDKPRHPDAHTTKHGLDEAELGTSFGDKLMHLREAITGQKQPTKEEASKAPLSNVLLSSIPEAVGQGMQAQGMAPALFGGVMAKTAGTAEKWFAGAEGKPRFEIPDSGSKLTLDKTRKAVAEGKKFTTLGDVLDHKELYKAYPDLKDMPVFHDKSMSLNSASFDPNTPKIIVGPQESEAVLHSTLLHEIQHAIQEKEGFARGTNPSAMVPAVAKAIVKKKIDLPNVSNDTINNTVFDAYRHVSGEVEARNVQFRHKWPGAAKIFSPELTEDIARDKQLNAPK